jgi:solute carrier family 50 protein (sugar transporter)
LTGIGIFLASWSPIKVIIERQELGSFDLVPNATLVINSISWFLYGLFVKKPYVAFPNIIGIEFMLYYIFSTYHLHSLEKRNLIRNIFLWGFFIVLVIAMIAFIGIYDTDKNPTIEDFNKAKTLLGITSVLILIVFYTSPLANLVQVIKSKDAGSINLALAIASGINGSLWACYGFAIADQVGYVFSC